MVSGGLWSQHFLFHRVQINKSIIWIRKLMCLSFREKSVAALQVRKDPSFSYRISNNTGRGKEVLKLLSCSNGKLYSKSFDCAKCLLMALFNNFYFVMAETEILQLLFHLSLKWLIFALEGYSWKTFTVCKMSLCKQGGMLCTKQSACSITQMFSMSVVMNYIFL